MTRDRISYWFDPGAEPAMTVQPGETVVVETEDAHSGTITGPDVVYETLDDVMERIGGANPVTGPIAVEGVVAGDLIEIVIEHVEGAPVTGYGYMNTTPTLHPDFTAETVICERRGDEVVIPTKAGGVAVPLSAFVGTIGVAPSDEPILSFQQSRSILGNVDMPDVRAGASVVLRANVDGALVSLGDAHLAQGDAEIHRSAIESQADVRLRIERVDADGAGYAGLPQVNSASELGSVAPGPGDLQDLVRAAYDDLAERLVMSGLYTLPEAYRLLGAVGSVRVGQVVPPVYSAMAKIDRTYVEEGSAS